MTPVELDAACAAACPHCAVGNRPRFRPETQEYVHDYAARDSDVLTPGLAKQGGPVRLARGTFAHTFCLATSLRREHRE
jgi:hypothetical protein